MDLDSIVLGQFPEEVDVPCDQVVLGDDANRVSELRQHLQAPPGELEPALDGLVAVGDAAHRQELRLPSPGGQLLPQQVWAAA